MSRVHGVIGPAPDNFRTAIPDEPWTVHCHARVSDWEDSSFGASAGYFPEGTPVVVRDRCEAKFHAGPLAGEVRELLLVRGECETGKRVTGWVLANGVVLP